MATKTNEMTAQLADKKKPQEQPQGQAEQTQADDGGLAMYVPQYNNNYVEVTPEQVDAVKQLYAIKDGEKATTYIERTTPKPKVLDEKKVKRAKLFAGISDAAMALADGITLSQGGYIAPRESAYGTASKAIEAQKAKAAKELAAYNKLYQEALLTDAKAAREARKGIATGVQKLYDDADTANRKIVADNLKAYNEANKTNVGAVNKAIEAAKEREFRANQYDKNRKTQVLTAGMRAAASGKDKDEAQSYLSLADGTQFPYSITQVRQHRGILNTIADLAIQNETDSRKQRNWKAWMRNGALGEDEINAITSGSSYFATPEGKQKFINLWLKLQNPGNAVQQTTNLSDTIPNLSPSYTTPTTLKPIEE